MANSKFWDISLKVLAGWAVISLIIIVGLYAFFAYQELTVRNEKLLNELRRIVNLQNETYEIGFRSVYTLHKELALYGRVYTIFDNDKYKSDYARYDEIALKERNVIIEKHMAAMLNDAKANDAKYITSYTSENGNHLLYYVKEWNGDNWLYCLISGIKKSHRQRRGPFPGKYSIEPEVDVDICHERIRMMKIKNEDINEQKIKEIV